MRAKKAAHAERRQQENDAAEEVCSRIALLPEKIKINTLYFEAKAYQEASSPPAEGCSAGRRTAKHQGVGQVQLGPKLHTNEDKSALFKLAQRTSLVPTCPVVKPTFLLHNCDSLDCSWFATLLHKEAGMQSFLQLQTTVLVLSGFSMWSLDADVDAALRLCQ